MKTTSIVLFLAISVLVPMSVATESASNAATTPAAGYVAPKIHQKVRPVYPMRVIYDGIVHGEANVLLEIDSRGQLTDHLLVSCTQRDFGDEAMRTVREWAFEPGTQDGRPVSSVVSVAFDFSVNGTIAYDKHFGGPRDEAFSGDRFSYFPRGASSLDRMPAPINTPQPAYAKAWIDEGREGSVTIQFYIDETGRARIPVIVSDSDRFLAAAAVAAVKEWRFEVPTFRGKPVLAQAEQVFVFQRPKT
jgi:TonB family protein